MVNTSRLLLVQHIHRNSHPALHSCHQGPGPYLFAALCSCICLITNLTTAVLIPDPYYVLRPRSSRLYLFGISLHHIHLGIYLPGNPVKQFHQAGRCNFCPLAKS
ncbi:hypothetical protein F5051DRAFT_149831 [Lentinula edodes]|nr:hypothetical protein F5051DRAFT_149831 [Lentinula edodes]